GGARIARSISGNWRLARADLRSSTEHGPPAAPMPRGAIAMHARSFPRSLALALLSSAIGCGPGPAPEDTARSSGRPFASAAASSTVFEWGGELVAPVTSKPEKYIKDQLFYTVGQLNAHASVGRLDHLALSVVTTQPN